MIPPANGFFGEKKKKYESQFFWDSEKKPIISIPRLEKTG
jgi:hypothetical protein